MDINKQDLRDILKVYYEQEYNIDTSNSALSGAEDFNDFCKKQREKLKTILAAFDINILDFKDNKKYYFVDSENEIITMLQYFDNFIVKNIRLKKKIEFSEFLFNNDMKEILEGACKFGNALNCFMSRNVYTPPEQKYKYIDVVDYNSESELYDELFGDLEKQILYLSNDSKFAPYMDKHTVDIIILLQDILAYVLETSLDESIDVISKDIPIKGLNTLTQDLTLVRDRYKKFFDIIYNGKNDEFPDFRYIALKDIK